MDEMDYNFEIARLESNAKLVKILLKSLSQALLSPLSSCCLGLICPIQ